MGPSVEGDEGVAAAGDFAWESLWGRMPSKKVSFDGSLDAKLTGRLEQPPGQIRAVALFAHCFTCSKDSLAASRISSALAACGIATLRFDFTGLGESGGDFGASNFSSNIEDLLMAADHLAATIGAPHILIGHSLGGAAVLAAAAGLPKLRAVVTLGAPADPAHVENLFVDDLDKIESKGCATVNLGGRSFDVRSDFVEDLRSHRLLDDVGKLGKPLLVMHSPIDKTVGVDNASSIFAAAKHPKSFISLDGADHLLSDPADATWVANVVASWAERFLDPPKDDRPHDGEGVLVRPTGNGKFAHHVRSGPHLILSDEPESMGGDDTGLSPYELVLGGLGACTSMTMRMYADHKKMALDDVEVRLSHAKVHASECGDCETSEGKVDVIDREIIIHGDLTDAERKRLMEIADRCPVHRTLHREVKVRTREVLAT